MVALGQLPNGLMKFDPCYRLEVYGEPASCLLMLQIFSVTSGKQLTQVQAVARQFY